MPRRATGSSEAKRHPLNLRTTLSMRQKIEAAATESGRSMMNEIEHRLENSFERDSVFVLLLGGTENGRLVQNLTFAVRDADPNWANDREKEKGLIEAIKEVVRAEGKARRAE